MPRCIIVIDLFIHGHGSLFIPILEFMLHLKNKSPTFLKTTEDRSSVYDVRVCSEANLQGVCHDFNEAVPYLSNYGLDNTVSSIGVTGV